MRYVGIFPTIQTTFDDIEFPADTPAWPFRPTRKIQDPFVIFVELDIQKAKDLFRKPFNFRDRSMV